MSTEAARAAKAAYRRKQKCVRILNPKSGCGWTTRRRAQQYQDRGLGELHDGVFAFYANVSDHRDQSVARAIDGRAPRDRRTRHSLNLHMIARMQAIRDSGIECPYLQWPLAPMRHPGKAVEAEELAA